jgi:peroxiredoxin
MQHLAQAPGFTLTDTTGEKVSLAQFRGQPLVLVLTRGFI